MLIIAKGKAEHCRCQNFEVGKHVLRQDPTFISDDDSSLEIDGERWDFWLRTLYIAHVIDNVQGGQKMLFE